MTEEDFYLAEKTLYLVEDALAVTEGKYVSDELAVELCELERIRDRLLDLCGME